jgi:quercetin dioxygenase-like cupin family protein
VVEHYHGSAGIALVDTDRESSHDPWLQDPRHLFCRVNSEEGFMSQAARHHQPGQAVFEVILPEEIEWKSFAAFPPSARLAVIVGQPSAEGPFTIRVKVPRGVKLMPHKHPEDRVYTVISGVFYIGLGDQFDAEKLQAYPPGAVIILPGNTPHFHWAKSGEYIAQVSAIGPLGLDYINPKDDPRNRKSR